MNIPTKLFRRRGSDSLPLTDATAGAATGAISNNGNGNVIPATGDTEKDQSSGGRPPDRRSLFFFGASSNQRTIKRATVDGSAKSIRLQKPLIQVWKEASVATRTTYILMLSFLFMFWLGIRFLRYNNAHIHLTCRAADCTLSIYPRGWSKQYKVEFPRRQLIDIFAVKVSFEGTFIERQNNLYESFREPPPQQPHHHHKGGGPPRKSSPMYSHYKGPDENGHYTSYALIFRSKRGFETMPEEKSPADAAAEGEHKEGGAEGESGGGEKPVSETTHRREEETSDAAAAAAPPPPPPQDASPFELVDFSPQLSEYLEDIGDGQHRLIMRLFQIPQSRRRVSTMIHRVESYIKKTSSVSHGQRKCRSQLARYFVTSHWHTRILINAIVGTVLGRTRASPSTQTSTTS